MVYLYQDLIGLFNLWVFSKIIINSTFDYILIRTGLSQSYMSLLQVDV